jgi:hypothetical protein
MWTDEQVSDAGIQLERVRAEWMTVKSKFLSVVIALAMFSGLACGASVTSTETTEFTSSEGFSFRYPADWIVVSKDKTAEVKAELKTIVAKFKYNLDNLAVVALGPEKGDSMNVLVRYTGGRRPEVGENAKPEVLEMVKQYTKDLGVAIPNGRVSVETFGPNKAMVARFTANVQDQELAILQVFMFGQWYAYTVTCTSSASNVARNEPIFAAMLSSLAIDLDASTVPRWLLVVVIACSIGICGGLAWLLVKLTMFARNRRLRGGQDGSGVSRVGKVLGGAIRLLAIPIVFGAFMPTVFGLMILFQASPCQPIHHVYDLFNMTYSWLFDLCMACAMVEIGFLLKLVANRLDGGERELGTVSPEVLQ